MSRLADAISALVGGDASPAPTPTRASAHGLAAAVTREVGSAGDLAAAAAGGTTRVPRSGAGRLRVAVIGDEGVAAATAGHLALEGFDVTWASPRAAVIEPYRTGVTLVGLGVGHPGVTTSLDEAVRGAQLVLICTHATEHAAYAALLAPVLTEGQVVVLSPGRTGGALEFAGVRAAHSPAERIVIGETETAVYTPAGRGSGRIEILAEKHTFRAAALPATDTPRLAEVLSQVYPQVTLAENVLDTSVNNVGGVVHPAAMLLNSYVTEQAAAGQPLIYYQDQVNPTVADLVMERLDAERVAVGQGLGLATVLDFVGWSLACFHHAAGSIRETVSTNPAYAGFGAPTTLLALGFVDDEVRNSLVPLSELGRLVGVATPMTDALISLACAMLAVDFRAAGRTLARLGLDGLDRDAVLDRVNHAACDAPALVGAR
jgi:opine dehydrogenase